MFIAMNRFRVAKGSKAAFEQVWLSRDSHLEKVPGFVEFHLLNGPRRTISPFIPPTPSGKTASCLRLGPNPRCPGQPGRKGRGQGRRQTSSISTCMTSLFMDHWLALPAPVPTRWAAP
jgi:hypothetical protein